MSDCIFCKIIAGEIPSATIYENDEFKVILDRFPSGEGFSQSILHTDGKGQRHDSAYP